MPDSMICTLLVSQSGGFQLLALARLWGVASCAPWGDGVEKPARRGHLTLPVDRPEEIEARQCVEVVAFIDGILDGSSLNKSTI